MIAPAYAAEMPPMHRHAAALDAVTLQLPDAPTPVAGAPLSLTLQLQTSDGKPLGPDRLATVHTQKFHLLVIDPTLTEYNHLHPTPDLLHPGIWHADFTPRTSGAYRLWADVKVKNGEAAFASAVLGTPPHPLPAIDTASKPKTSLEGVTVSLADPGKLQVSDDKGRPVKLIPVLGAFAHIVGFSGFDAPPVHVHAEGGDLSVHVPELSGPTHFFVQVHPVGRGVLTAPLVLP